MNRFDFVKLVKRYTPRRANILFTFQTGYQLVMYPVGVLTASTTLYYLMVQNIEFLKIIFPRYYEFLFCGIFLGFPVILFLGQWFLLSPLNKASTRTNPYAHKLIPTQFALYESMAILLRDHGHIKEAEQIEKLVEESRRQW